MSEDTSIHYDEKYYNWQSPIGEFGGWADLSKFLKYISSTDVVLDFGCGGGFLLKQIKCKTKLGVELNMTAAEHARKNGIDVFPRSELISDSSVDVIISNHVLEHTLNPFEELKILFKKLKPGGKIVFVVPCESISCGYKLKDINHHLFSWSPMCLGNLFTAAGFIVLESKPYLYKWPPFYKGIAKLGGRKIFEMACYIHGKISRRIAQVRLVATKK